MQVRFKSIVTAFFVAIVISLQGCGCFRGILAPPGPLYQQQANAVIHDPYPENDIAPYEAASRPPGYQNPLPEPVRNQLLPPSARPILP